MVHVAYGYADCSSMTCWNLLSVRHRSGPSKKLAPATRPETACSHTFTHDEGVYLEIDCESCAGAHDLWSRSCIVGVVNAASTGPRVDAIVLRRTTHKRYRGEIVQCVMSLAAALSALNRAISSAQTPDERQCRTCPGRKQVILQKAKAMLLEDPLTWNEGVAKSIADDLEARAACSRARECVARGLAGVLLQEGR